MTLPLLKTHLSTRSTWQLWALALLVFLMAAFNANAQVGNTCGTPIVITTLPFDDAGTTSAYGDDYELGDVPPLATDAVTTGTGSNYYLSGDDVVYAYTPSGDQVITITTTNDDDWIGLWAFTGCPFASTVGYHTSISGATRAINNLPVQGGTTYYLVISTWAAPQSTNFTIHIELISSTGGEEDCLGVMNGTALPGTPCIASSGLGGMWSATCDCDENVGIEEVRNANGMSVFPNPASTELFISTPDNKPVHVKVYNMVGHLVMETDVTTQLNVADLAAGSYSLIISDAKGNIQARTRFMKH
ncbi:MAG: T9SS type A sorting domain-containing protein [Flavobacteriales bacterium]